MDSFGLCSLLGWEVRAEGVKGVREKKGTSDRDLSSYPFCKGCRVGGGM